MYDKGHGPYEKDRRGVMIMGNKDGTEELPRSESPEGPWGDITHKCRSAESLVNNRGTSVRDTTPTSGDFDPDVRTYPTVGQGTPPLPVCQPIVVGPHRSGPLLLHIPDPPTLLRALGRTPRSFRRTSSTVVSTQESY